MALIARIIGDHTVRDFQAAATLRYHEARRLAISGDRLTAIYLWGYTTEMLLKAAYFRLTGWSLTQPITLADLHHAKNHANAVLGLGWGTNLHDLSRWKDLLVEERKRRALPYTWAFTRSLNARVKQVYLNWREHLRYRTNRPYLGEMSQTFQAVSWLLGQYRYL